MEKKGSVNKRGSIIDIIFFVIVIIVAGVALLVSGMIFPTLHDSLNATQPFQDSEAGQQGLEHFETTYLQFDNFFLVFFSSLVLVLLITAYFLDSSPILIPIYLFLSAFIILIAAIGQRIYTSLASEAAFAVSTANQPITAYLFSHLIMASLGVVVLSIILIFAKPRSAGGGL